MKITNSHLKGNIGESLVGAALVEEFVSLGDGAGYFPLGRCACTSRGLMEVPGDVRFILLVWYDQAPNINSHI